MLKTLIKKQLLELFQTYFIDRKTGKARSKTGTAVFFALLAVLFVGLGFAVYAMGSGLGGAILGNGMDWLYFGLMGLLAMVLGVFGSVFNTYASVYLPKDNELLLALPIPGRTLLLARLSGVYITSLMYSAWIWIPATAAYWMIVPVNALRILCPILMTFVIALFVSVLSCALGWVVALIAAKAKGRSIVTTALSLAVVALYYVVYFKIVNSIGEILANIERLGDAIRSWLHYVYLMGRGADGEVLPLLLTTAITAALAGCCLWVLSRTFLNLSTAGGSGGKRTKVPANYAGTSLRTALLRRELRHFTSVSTWMLNGGLGLLLLPIAAAAILIKSAAIREILPEIAESLPRFSASLPVLLTAVVCLLLSVNAILPVSVSMEGKTIWQLQSLPVDPWEILRAKESMGVLLNTAPAELFTLAAGTVFRLSWWETAMACAAVWLFIWVISDFGLFLNLKMPNLRWTNEASLTKQSVPVMISLFGGWAFCAALGFGGFLLTEYADAGIVLAGVILLFAALWMILRRWLKRRGTAIFAEL